MQTQLTPAAAIDRLFTTPQIQADWFAPSFLNQIPVAQVEQIIGQLKGELGAYQQVQVAGDRYLVVFERGRVPTQIVLNASGQITGLLFQGVLANAIGLEAAIDQLRAFPGQVNFLVVEDSAELAALNADQPLAVGSAFKLAVLAALRQQIEVGQRAWSDVVDLQPQDKSLPSGFLQTWPDGSRLTLETLATLMISISDNTATDTLMRVVGREAIEAFTPNNRPFLTTREFFTLKATPNAEWLDRYQMGNLDQKRQVLAAIAPLPLPAVNQLSSEPTALDVEWLLSARELCSLMAQVADLPLMSITTAGVADPEDWLRVSYKGGSEPGVLNLTTELVAKNGKTYCVSATWNHADAVLDETQLLTLYSAVVQGLLERP